MRAPTSLALLGALAGCWVPIERGQQMEARIQRLEQEDERLSKQADEQRTVIRDQVAKVDAKIDELNKVAHRTGADLAVNQEKMQEELTRLKGMLEEERHKLESM